MKLKILMAPHVKRVNIAREKYPQYEIDEIRVKFWTPELMEKYDLCCPQTDEQCLAVSNMDLPEEKLIIPQAEVFILANNKVNMNNWMIEHGFEKNVPEMNPESLPVIIKPIIGASSEGINVVEEGEYEVSEGSFVQAYETNGDYEYSSNIVAINGQVAYGKTYKFNLDIYDDPFKSTSTHDQRKEYLDNGKIEIVSPPIEAVQFIAQLTDKLKINGTYNIQYSIIDGVVKFYEMNARMSATGIHFFDELVESYLGLNLGLS